MYDRVNRRSWALDHLLPEIFIFLNFDLGYNSIKILFQMLCCGVEVSNNDPNRVSIMENSRTWKTFNIGNLFENCFGHLIAWLFIGPQDAEINDSILPSVHFKVQRLTFDQSH